jgi:uncharacterized membrane protein YkoI
MYKHSVKFIVALLAAVGAASAVYATQIPRENDAFVDLAKAKINITQAIVAAEQATPGKATRAELENEQHGLVYQVEIADASTKKVSDVMVDGVSGKVLSVKADTGDKGKDAPDND